MKLFLRWSLCTITTILVSAVALASEDKLSDQLKMVLDRTDKAVPVVVMLKPLPLLPQTLVGNFTTTQVESAIKSIALRSQAGLREFVYDTVSSPSFTGEKAISKYKFFWNVNAMMATVTQEALQELIDRDDVQFVHLDAKIKLTPVIHNELDGSEVEGEYTYGLEKIGVPSMRQDHPELNGQGVVVGILDTGIDANHPEFKGRVKAFKDFVGSKTEAYDDHGHGSHVAGTIGGVGAAGTQIGIAPGVTYVIGKIFNSQGSGNLSQIIRGMEWIANPEGKEDSKLRPRVVNNSWGGSLGSDVNKDPFAQGVNTWVQLEIFPSFAAGNSGPRASTVGSPGGFPQSFAVGATDSNDAAASFSSRGPVKLVVDGAAKTFIKPDVSAPGVKVLSAMPGGKYGSMSGTSMATPHVTGAVAILYQANPRLRIQEMRELVMKSSTDLGDKGLDNTFGQGRLDLAKAVTTLMMEQDQ